MNSAIPQGYWALRSAPDHPAARGPGGDRSAATPGVEVSRPIGAGERPSSSRALGAGLLCARPSGAALAVPIGVCSAAATGRLGLGSRTARTLAGIRVSRLFRIGRVNPLVSLRLDHPVQLVDLGHVDNRLRRLGLLAAECAGPPAHVMADRIGFDLDRK